MFIKGSNLRRGEQLMGYGYKRHINCPLPMTVAATAPEAEDQKVSPQRDAEDAPQPQPSP